MYKDVCCNIIYSDKKLETTEYILHLFKTLLTINTYQLLREKTSIKVICFHDSVF